MFANGVTPPRFVPPIPLAAMIVTEIPPEVGALVTTADESTPKLEEITLVNDPMLMATVATIPTPLPPPPPETRPAAKLACLHRSVVSLIQKTASLFVNDGRAAELIDIAVAPPPRWPNPTRVTETDPVVAALNPTSELTIVPSIVSVLVKVVRGILLLLLLRRKIVLVTLLPPPLSNPVAAGDV